MDLKETELSLDGLENPYPELSFNQVVQLKAYQRDRRTKEYCDKYYKLLAKKESLELSISKLKSSLANRRMRYKASTQSSRCKGKSVNKTMSPPPVIEEEKVEIVKSEKNKSDLERYVDALQDEVLRIFGCDSNFGDPTITAQVRRIRTCINRAKRAINDLPFFECERTIFQLEKKVMDFGLFEPPSCMDFILRPVVESEQMITMRIGPEGSDTTIVHENLTDVAGEEPDMKESVTPLVPEIGQVNLLDIGDFFSRPVRLHSSELDFGTDFDLNLDLWTLYLLQPSVRAKLRNQAFLRATMCVRITTEGTPFDFGKLLVSPQPLEGWNDNLQYLNGVTAPRFALLNYLAQGKWSKVLDIKENRPLELKIPIIGPQPVIRLFNQAGTSISAATPFDDATDLLHLHIHTLNQIQSVSATPSKPALVVYAWLEDVTLGAPTGTLIQITTESKRDEREAGPLERLATNAGAFLSHLTKVPDIGPFAEAGTFIAGGIAWVASLLGWSYPTMINEPSRMRPDGFQNGAQVIGYDTGHRITLDPKQSVTCDPRMVSSTMDEMSIAHVAGQESLLDTFSWLHTDEPTDGSIWLCPINPFISKRIFDTDHYVISPTSLAFAATPFDYWRGDITFRFEFVVSNFHRGKMMVYFEPNVAQAALIDATQYLNKQFTYIIDLQETQDMTVCVNWAHCRAWARVMDTTLLGDVGDLSSVTNSLFDFANGYIGIVPLTTLQSPNSSDVQVNVYVMSENIVFNQIDGAKLPIRRPNTESSREFTPQVESGRLLPEETKCVELNKSSASMEHIGEFHFGEFPVSFRGLVKRFCGYQDPDGLIVTEFGSTSGHIEYGEDIYPPPYPSYFSYDGGAAQPNLLAYLRHAYLGLRGGMKHRVGVASGFQTFQMDRVKVHLLAPNILPEFFTPRQSGDRSQLLSRLIGSADIVPNVNGGIEFETPFYSNNLFGIAFHEDAFPATNQMVDPMLTRGFLFVASHVNDLMQTVVDGQSFVTHDIAAAEDFSLMCYQGAPPYRTT